MRDQSRFLPGAWHRIPPRTGLHFYQENPIMPREQLIVLLSDMAEGAKERAFKKAAWKKAQKKKKRSSP
jgi:hypothetical protein